MEIRDLLKNVNSSFTSREKAAQTFKKDPGLIKAAVSLLSDKDQGLKLKALYSLEFLARQRISLLYPHLPALVKYAENSQNSSANRCLAKIFCLTTEEISLKTQKEKLSFQIRDSIIETFFTWLIGNESPAVKVFSMQSLFNLKNHKDWIALELRSVLEKDFKASSAAYQSRARKILRKLEHEFSDKI
ncbi:hypothetical protein E0K83_15345 [Gramella sp. BOM4]|nr:hypothetical protein [Christiangramia bathymodioli]